MKNVLQPFVKSVLITLGLIETASVADAGIRKNFLGSGNTTLIISNKEMEYIMKIVKSLEDSGLLTKGITETIEKKKKEQKGGFLGMLYGKLGASLLGNMLVGKRVTRAGEGANRVGQDF